jgi:hypothetical protein
MSEKPTDTQLKQELPRNTEDDRVLEANERIAKDRQETSGLEKEQSRQERERTEERERRVAEQEAAPQSRETQDVHEAPADKSREVPTQANRKQAYNEIMTDAKVHMSKGERAFSSFIHHPVVEKVSDAGAKTVARPNALLAGSMSAFFFVLAIYIVANYYGYPLSGAESILAFAAGWLVGVLYDFFKIMITGKHS